MYMPTYFDGLIRFRIRLDENIELFESIGLIAEHLDVRIENRNGNPMKDVFHKPAHELYYLPYTSVHAEPIKKNIPVAALVRAIRNSSTYTVVKREEAHICMALLLNRYPVGFILRQLQRVPRTFQCGTPIEENYAYVRKLFLEAVKNNEKKANLVIRFHQLWNDCFRETAFSRVKSIVGSIRLDNLQAYLVRKKPNRVLRTIK